MKITYLEAVEGLIAGSPEWNSLAKKITLEKPDILVTNELPFGRWLPRNPKFDALDATTWVKQHDAGLGALKQLDIPVILSSRPLSFDGKLVNEAFTLMEGEYNFAHQKHYFPAEPGFYETSWFDTQHKGFETVFTKGISVGFMLCTELMFNEWARSYRHKGAQLIVAPRATGINMDSWKTAASMAAVVSGCYVVSSNRVGPSSDGQEFGGKGFAFAPDGSLISETSLENPVVSFELDLEKVKTQQQEYPCYVGETGP